MGDVWEVYVEGGQVGLCEARGFYVRDPLPAQACGDRLRQGAIHPVPRSSK